MQSGGSTVKPMSARGANTEAGRNSLTLPRPDRARQDGGAKPAERPMLGGASV